ncbi:hypothetical protein OIU84_009994 [Salix udensis]|uniref:Uncharacterized protein n=1 Tax=Salix udensis TaxID=889485 RepID=A0AAD6JJQ2_9ROSI|nr:hypothetical protein OIU84_009994 [Salix udensis]
MICRGDIRAGRQALTSTSRSPLDLEIPLLLDRARDRPRLEVVAQLSSYLLINVFSKSLSRLGMILENPPISFLPNLIHRGAEEQRPYHVVDYLPVGVLARNPCKQVIPREVRPRQVSSEQNRMQDLRSEIAGEEEMLMGLMMLIAQPAILLRLISLMGAVHGAQATSGS